MTLTRRRWALSATILSIMGMGGSLLMLAARDQPDPPPADARSQAFAPSVTSTSSPSTRTVSRGNPSGLLLANPVVSMNAERGLLEATLTVTITRPDGYPVRGAISVTGIPKLEASSKRFYLREPVITALQLPELGEQDRAALTAAIRTFFLSRPVFAPFEPGGLRIPPMEAMLAATGS